MTFIELRCGYTEDDIEEKGPNRCLSSQNDTPQDWAGDTLDSVASTFSNLISEAKSSGWVVTKSDGLLCPSCFKKYETQQSTAL